jgi:uncharacterized protein YpiB (UPF0302 family)
MKERSVLVLVLTAVGGLSWWLHDRHFLVAGDAASACSATLVIAKFMARESPKQTAKMKIAFFDGEEAFGENITPQDGLFGSRHYASQWHSRDDKPADNLKIILADSLDISIRVTLRVLGKRLVN